MIFAVDVQYKGSKGYAGGIIFSSWGQSKPDKEVLTIINDIHEYIPGQFYKRELPCILQLLEQLNEKPEVIIIDGYVYLTSKTKWGLGAYLYEALEQKIPVIGVAKTKFNDTPEYTKLYRGKSTNPLFISVAGYDLDLAKEHIHSMEGNFRIPVLLKYVDRLCRNLAASS